MTTKNLFALAVSVLLLFASCNQEEPAPEVNDGRVQFASGISGTQTRVGGVDGDQWENGDAIGIYMVGNRGTTVAESAENIQYKTTSTGAAATFMPGDVSKTIYYPVDATQKVDFIAYHPYNPSVDNYVYPVDVTEQGNQSAIDLMRVKADNDESGYDKTQSGYVNLVFDHTLTKVIFNTTPDAGLTVADLADMAVTVKGLHTKADYNIDTDVLGAPDAVAPIAVKTTTAGTLYEAIVVPQSFTAGVVTVEFALNNAKNEVFEYKVPATTFAKTEKHTFNVKVQRTGVEVRGTINPWEPVGAVDGTAK